MVKMMDNYATNKTRLVSCCRMMIAAITIFSFSFLLFGLSMLGEISVAAGSISSSQIGGQEFEGEEQQEVEWLLYENATHGVRILYPSNWTQQDSTVVGDESFISVSDFFSPAEAEKYFAYVTIGIDNMPPSTNLEDNLNETIDNFMQDPTLRDFQVLSSSTSDFTLAGMPAYSFRYSYTDPEFGPQYALTVETIIDNKGYSIQYIADTLIYEKYLSIVERMIESFEIMQQ